MANGTLAVSQLEILTQTGTGIITVVPPATNTNRTLTLPDATGTVVASGTTPSLNGITFPATQVPSSDANTLDDYEEGTFTPSLSATGTAPSITYVFRTGTYIKIGRLVTAYIKMQWSAYSGATGFITVTGLPFTVGNESDETGGVIGLALNWNIVPLAIQQEGAANFIYVLRGVNNANSPVADAGTNGYFFFSITYLV